MSDGRGRGNASGSGIGFLGMLFLVFLVLKLMNIIDWKWIWVIAPLWCIPAFLVLILIGGFLFVWIKELTSKRSGIKKRRNKK